MMNENRIQEAPRLKDEANKLFNIGDLQMSINLYSQAIDLSKLPDEDLAILYSNRSAAYLKVYEEQNQSSSDWRSLALRDAERALTLRPTWVKAHFRAACAYKSLSRFEEALKHFDMAVGMAPAKSYLKNARDDCRRLLGMKIRCEPAYNEVAEMQKLGDRLGTKVTPAVLRKTEKHFKTNNDPHGFLMEGHRYEHGRDCKQNYAKAAECFAKAASLGNADAKYNLARLTKSGLGVKQDFNLALKLFKETADCPLTESGNLRNTAVAEAEHSIGLMYEEGVGVLQNEIRAAEWYQRSSDHGCGNASNNLGVLYLSGRGVERNVDRAVQYFKLAASRQNPQAMTSLAHHYLHCERDPIEAMKWHKMALKNGDDYLAAEKQVLQMKEGDNLRDQLGEFEAVYGFSRQNLTLIERESRMMETILPNEGQLCELFERLRNSDNKLPFNTHGSSTYRFNLKMLEEYASTGSTTAQVLQKATIHFKTGMYILQSSAILDRILDREKEESIIREFANCQRIQYIVASWSEDTIKKTNLILMKILNRSPHDLPSDVETDARICYTALHINNFQEIKMFLMESIRKFPTEAYFYETYCSILAFMQQYKKSVQEANMALNLFPNNLDLLYYKAVSQRFVADNCVHDVLKAYNEFLAVAPPDHRKIPECYYAIGIQYRKMDYAKDRVKSMKTAKKLPAIHPEVIKYFNMGIEAEKIQLPCFLPYDSNAKTILQGIVDPKIPPPASIPTKIKSLHDD